VRAGVVNARVLAEVARELDLGAYLLLGKGEDAAGGAPKQSILADAFEAVVAAVYLDSGLATTRDLVLRCLASASPKPRPARRPRLQDASPGARRRARLGRPRYVVRDEGPDHAKHFFARVLRRRAYGDGEGAIEEAGRASGGWVAWTPLQRRRLAGRGGQSRSYLRSRSCARSREEIVGKKIKSVEVTERARCAGTRTSKEFIELLEGARSFRAATAGASTLVEARRTDGLDRAPRHVRSAAAREDRAREGAEAHARR
jgi:hypothetical protein